MCGIAGMVTATPGLDRSARAVRATHGLYHRGPDETRFLVIRDGSWELVESDGEVGAADIVAGSCRLSIVDVEGGHQPLANETSTVWVTYNGEIYNQHELRAQLESRGHRFGTHADTEVLVHGWEEWGAGLLPRLNGIFAFAIFDLRTREIVLARDPLGVKPLYLGIDGPSTWWCSELAPAADAGLRGPGGLSADALRLFLTFRFVPSPFAVWENVWKLPPASFVRFGVDDVGRPPRFERYSTDIRSPLTPASRAEWQEALMVELESAVTRQLMSDVPVASLLSGGIDSSLTTLFMTEHLPAPPQAFGVGFSSDGHLGEAEAGALAAREIGAPFHSQTLRDDEYDHGWPVLLARMGEPTGNTSSSILHSICVEVGKTHKVGLCGQGADELLGGYPRHAAERLYPLGRRAPGVAGRLAARAYGSGAQARLTRILGTTDRIDRYLGIFAHLPPEEVDRLVPGGSATTIELGREVLARWAGEDEPDDSLNDLLRVDTRVSLADDLLMVADLCSMYESVELRVPFLDLAFVDLAERMPSSYKIGPLGNRKWLYRRAAAARLPEETSRRLCRPTNRLQRKRGFSPPQGTERRSGPEAWLGPLQDVDALDAAELGRIASEDRDAPRRDTVLGTLSRWIVAHRS